MPQTPLASDPRTRASVDKDRGFGGFENGLHPTDPQLIETPCSHHPEKTGPADHVEWLSKIQFEHQRWLLPFVAYLNQFEGIYESVVD